MVVESLRDVRLLLLAASGIAWASSNIPAYAEGPEQLEQLEQLEPESGEWQTEYSGTFGGGSGSEHAVEAMVGIDARLAIGLELEAEIGESGISLESLGPKLIYRITGKDASIALGMQMQIALGEGGSLNEVEGRVIAERKDERWWAQWNGMIRRSSREGRASTRLAYAWSIQHVLGGSSWL